MKFLQVGILLLVSIYLPGQDLNTTKPINEERKVIMKWNKSVIDLECNTNKLDQPFIDNVLFTQFSKKEISTERYFFLEDSLSSIQYSNFGTAIYLEYNDQKYLLSVRHVLKDTFGIYPYSIVPHIFLVPFGDAKEKESFSLNDMVEIFRLNQFPYDSSHYIFSSENDDLAIISLNDSSTLRFTHMLDDRGYVPVSFNDIDTSNSYKNFDKIFCLGYPDFALKSNGQQWGMRMAHAISVPVLSSGEIIKRKNGQYCVNAFLAHGNSGGPIIFRNRMIGLVSHVVYDKFSTDDSKFPFYYHSGIDFVKASEILQYLRILSSKKVNY